MPTHTKHKHIQNEERRRGISDWHKLPNISDIMSRQKFPKKMKIVFAAKIKIDKYLE